MFFIRIIRKRLSACDARESEALFLFLHRIYTLDQLTVSLEPCLNLCSFKWLKFSLRRVSSLRPLVSCIAKTEFSLGLIKLMIVSLNLFTDTIFRISSLSAHHCLIENG